MLVQRAVLRGLGVALMASSLVCTPARPSTAAPPPTPLPRPAPPITPPPVSPTPPRAKTPVAPSLPRAFGNAPSPAVVQGTIEKAVLGLDGSKNGCPGAYDYFPQGGMQIFYCHLKDRLDYATVEKLSGVSVFSDGPHRNGQLDLAAKSFGRYNLTFVRWLAKAIPGLGNATVRRAVQPVYDKSIKPLARIFYVTYRKLSAKPSYLRKEKRHYASLVSRKRTAGYYEKFFYFMSPGFYARPKGSMSYFNKHGFDGGVDGNVTKTCTAFWIRRSLDGTAQEFFAGLKSLLRLYDAAFLRAVQQVNAATGSHRAVIKM